MKPYQIDAFADKVDVREAKFVEVNGAHGRCHPVNKQGHQTVWE
jgi:hypothetical protein